MSYDLWVEIDAGGPEPMTAGDWNYTSNCARMWDEAGAPIRDWDGKRAGDVAPDLGTAIAVLRGNPDRFRAMNPPNGWGDYDSLLPALEELVDMFRAYPNANVRVSR